jgi:hypothetical protein
MVRNIESEIQLRRNPMFFVFSPSPARDSSLCTVQSALSEISISISIIKILSSLNTTIYFDVIKKEKQLHVSACGHRQVGSFGFARKNAFCNALLIYHDWKGGRDLVLQSVGFLFWRVLGVSNV